MSKETRTRVFIEIYIEGETPSNCAAIASRIANKIGDRYKLTCKYHSQEPLSFFEINRMDEEIELLKYPSNLK